jgi:RHS repeat-associated protein
LSLSFTRGLDLSGTPQGAGGAGGLLWVWDRSTINSQPSTHAACYDGYGNVMALVNLADGTTSAEYAYGPFAEPLQATGPMAKANPLRFSTQYADDVTGDVNYLFRAYTVCTGRWPNRDPIEEEGGLSLYGFVDNGPVNVVDILGLRDLTPQENQIRNSLEALAAKAVTLDDAEFAKAVREISKDYETLIKSVSGPNDPARIGILNKAFSIWADPDQARSYLFSSGTGSWKGKNKCNKYVADALIAGKVDAQITVAPTFPWQDPVTRWPIAGEWADAKKIGKMTVIWEIRPLPGSRPGQTAVLQWSQPLLGQLGPRPPMIGDIVSFGEATTGGSDAHVGIALSHGLYISATSAVIHGQTGVVIKWESTITRRLYRSPY